MICILCGCKYTDIDINGIKYISCTNSMCKNCRFTEQNICERDDYFSRFLRESIEKSINQKTEEKKNRLSFLGSIRRWLSKIL